MACSSVLKRIALQVEGNASLCGKCVLTGAFTLILWKIGQILHLERNGLERPDDLDWLFFHAIEIRAERFMPPSDLVERSFESMDIQ